MDIPTSQRRRSQPAKKDKKDQPLTEHDELESDGSASAFSASESLPDAPDPQQDERARNTDDPSGNSNY